MTPWTDVVMYVPGRKRPSALTGIARENLLRMWAEGDRRYVVRVTDVDGNDLTPSQIDWSTMDEPPRLRVGRPVTRGNAKQVLVRLSAEEYERVAASARAASLSVGAWVRDVATRAARP
jgi:hypothetical protein